MSFGPAAAPDIDALVAELRGQLRYVSEEEWSVTNDDLTAILDDRDRLKAAADSAYARGREDMRREAAEAARSHKGKAKQNRIEKVGKRFASFTPEGQNEILAEEGGEDIAASIIADAILALPPAPEAGARPVDVINEAVRAEREAILKIADNWSMDERERLCAIRRRFSADRSRATTEQERRG